MLGLKSHIEYRTTDPWEDLMTHFKMIQPPLMMANGLVLLPSHPRMLFILHFLLQFPENIRHLSLALDSWSIKEGEVGDRLMKSRLKKRFIEVEPAADLCLLGQC